MARTKTPDVNIFHCDEHHFSAGTVADMQNHLRHWHGGSPTVSEAGKRGGSVAKQRYGHDFYVSIGKKGGSKVKELIAAGKKALKK